MDSRYEFSNGVLEKIKTPKMVVSGHQIMGLNNYENGDVDVPESFTVDLENVTCDVDNGLANLFYKTNSNSRITLQRSLCKKSPQHGNGRNCSDRDALAPSSSPKAAEAINTHLGKSISSDNYATNHPLPQHQITIKACSTTTVPEGRLGRRSSFKRSQHSWFNDPKRILFFFATLSSMGTMLLILLTLSMSKRNERGGISGWQ